MVSQNQLGKYLSLRAKLSHRVQTASAGMVDSARTPFDMRTAALKTGSVVDVCLKFRAIFSEVVPKPCQMRQSLRVEHTRKLGSKFRDLIQVLGKRMRAPLVTLATCNVGQRDRFGVVHHGRESLAFAPEHVATSTVRAQNTSNRSGEFMTTPTSDSPTLSIMPAIARCGARQARSSSRAHAARSHSRLRVGAGERLACPLANLRAFVRGTGSRCRPARSADHKRRRCNTHCASNGAAISQYHSHPMATL